MKNIFNSSEINAFFQWISVTLCLGLYAGISLAQEAGSIARVSGSAEIKGKDGKTREAKAKDSVNVADRIVTKAGGQVMVRLQDKSSLLVRENSEVVIEAFKFEKKSDDVVSTSVVSGAVRAVSGQIASGNPANAKYAVGTATVGIRGTDIELAIIGEGRRDRAGIYNYVYSGETQMSLASGESVVVEKETSGFTPSNPQPGEPRIQILRDRPAFLQTTSFDALIQQLSTPRIPTIR
jgi:hypothetical protein